MAPPREGGKGQIYKKVPRMPRTYPVGSFGILGSKKVFFLTPKWAKSGQRWSDIDPKLTVLLKNSKTKNCQEVTQAEKCCHSAKGKGTENRRKTPKSDHKSAQRIVLFIVRMVLVTVHPNCLAVVCHVCFRLYSPRGVGSAHTQS